MTDIVRRFSQEELRAQALDHDDKYEHGYNPDTAAMLRFAAALVEEVASLTAQVAAKDRRIAELSPLSAEEEADDLREALALETSLSVTDITSRHLVPYDEWSAQHRHERAEAAEAALLQVRKEQQSEQDAHDAELARTTTYREYRVVSVRDGCRKVKTYRGLKLAQDRVGMMTSAEPWRFYGDAEQRARDGSDYFCCPGTRYDECGCGGTTVMAEAMAKREGLPPLESIVIETRIVTKTTIPWARVPDADQTPTWTPEPDEDDEQIRAIAECDRALAAQPKEVPNG